MKTQLANLIKFYRAQVRAALWQNDREQAALLISMISGFRVLLRMQDAPERCAVSPPAFSQYV